MIKLTFIPTNNESIVIPLPDEYRGREVEVLLYATDEVTVVKPTEDKTHKVTMADFFGTMSNETVALLRASAEQSRKEWDRDF